MLGIKSRVQNIEEKRKIFSSLSIGASINLNFHLASTEKTKKTVYVYFSDHNLKAFTFSFYKKLSVFHIIIEKHHIFVNY